MANLSTLNDGKVRFQSLRKEVGLLFLAAFYFLIATNTQSGWLLLMSAFLLGLLLISWLGPRRAIERIKVQQKVLNQAQLGQSLNIEFRISNLSTKTVKELLVKAPSQTWSQNPEFRWLTPALTGKETATGVYSWIPDRRGEHRLEGVHLVCGDPFGLFTVYRNFESPPPFLIYPKLESLPKAHSKSRLSGLLAQLSSPRSRGESRAIRSLREYRTGDDLRRVHWKSSAKLSGTGPNLLVCEYLAPAKQAATLVLDTSHRPAVDEAHFEKSVSLVASTLWAAHRSGTRNSLLTIDPEGNWSKTTRWRDQYRVLAQVMQQPELDFEDWCKSLHENPGNVDNSERLFLFTTSYPHFTQQSVGWAASTFVVTDHSKLKDSTLPASMIRVDAEQPGFQELSLHV